ncbi:MAG: hypothetical protein FWD24_02460 [Treponema sp.]|nr:hypothetical protein [Treponema sp.]
MSNFEKSITRRREDAKVFLAIFVVVLLFVGCNQDGDEPGPLHGLWISEYDEVFFINLNDNTIVHSYDWDLLMYKGTIKEIVFFNNTAGIIFIEYTNTDGWTIVEEDGKFTGIYFLNLTENTVELKNAAAGTYPNSYTPTTLTLSAAKAKFTIDKIGDYFSFGSACVKQ